MRYTGVMVVVMLALISAGCGFFDMNGVGADETSSLSGASLSSLPAFPPDESRAALPDSAPRQSSGLLSYDFVGIDYVDGKGVSEHPTEWTEAILLTPEAGGFAWASFSLAVPLEEAPQYDRFYGVNLDVDDANVEDEEYLPPHPYWIGVANYAKGGWDWNGPYTDFMEQIEPGHDASKATYISPAGNVNIVILSYCPAEATPAATSVMYVGCNLTDVEPGEDPIGGEPL